jgi:hypothetical protein
MRDNTWLWHLANSFLIILVAAYAFISKNLGNEAYSRCDDLEKELALQKERCDNISKLLTKRDSIVINFNYNDYHIKKIPNKK